MQEKKRVLIITPWVPYPMTGACQQDRFLGMRQMQSMGYDVRVLAKIHGFQDEAKIRAAYDEVGVPLQLVPYMKNRGMFLLSKIPAILRNPGLLDGAAIEYLDPVYLRALRETIDRWKPDVLWVEYSVHWALLDILEPYDIPIIVKSSLNEPRNCMDEHGRTLMSQLKALPKYVGERAVARKADYVLAITPNEEEWYRSLGATSVSTLPLRGLSACFAKKVHTHAEKLHAVFLSSNYNMGHNRDALRFVLTKIVPLVQKELPGKVQFHLTGSKFPSPFQQYLSDDVRYEGFVPDLSSFLSSMDIAVCPWISGQGMQQKVFEPLCRSLPLLTTHTGGYPFIDGKEVLLCDTAKDYVAGIRSLLDANRRQAQADAAYRKAESLFSEKAVSSIVRSTVDTVTLTA